MSVLDAMADHLMGLAPWPDVQGNNPSSIATESPTPGRQRFRNDGPVGMFEVDFSGTLYEGINYVRGPGSAQKLGTPPPMARHGMVFAGLLGIADFHQQHGLNKSDGCEIPLHLCSLIECIGGRGAVSGNQCCC